MIHFNFVSGCICSFINTHVYPSPSSSVNSIALSISSICGPEFRCTAPAINRTANCNSKRECVCALLTICIFSLFTNNLHSLNTRKTNSAFVQPCIYSHLSLLHTCVCSNTFELRLVLLVHLGLVGPPFLSEKKFALVSCTYSNTIL